MPSETITNFNWVDILIISLFIRICYIAFKNGLYSECLKMLGTVTATYLALHYYTRLTNFLVEDLSLQVIPPVFLDFLTFFLLAALGYLFFMLLREVFSRFIKTEAGSLVSKWAGLIVGALRACLFVSLVLYVLVVSSITYFAESVNRSYLGRTCFKVAPATYSWLWNNVLSKFTSGETINSTVQEVEGRLRQ